ncbi:MAG: phosphoethanolamine transferase domain-containing protein, partial [Parabacteroides sp.]|nr:phosphoethanolamine transferase domain-containing protein [Parabacteroides sp.]
MKNYLKEKATLTSVSLLLSLFTLIAFHYPVFNYAANNVDGGLNGMLIIGGAALIMLALNFFIYYILLYLGRFVGKLLLAFSFIGNAIMLYFVVTYEALVTDSMMGNVFNTRYSEASGFFSLATVFYILFLGVLPCLYIFMRKMDYGKFSRFLKNIGVALLI